VVIVASGGALERLARAAANLGGQGLGRKALPPLLVFTDPHRTPDPEALAAALPPGAALVYRTFGDADALERARALRDITLRRGVLLLIGADDRLADACDADGVHLPERLIHRLPRILARRPGWHVTTAAHSLAAGRRGLRLGADAVVMSTVFPSLSPSAGEPMGAAVFARRVRRLGGPVYALGGVNAQTIAELRGSGAAGVAVVGAASPPPRA
jgi:thiamine-phosphate pyrophosphorylase